MSLQSVYNDVDTSHKNLFVMFVRDLTFVLDHCNLLQSTGIL